MRIKSVVCSITFARTLTANVSETQKPVLAEAFIQIPRITFLATGVSFVVLFFWLSKQQEEHIMEQVRKQAIILYKQILLTRQWVAEHNSVLVAKTEGVGSSRFLDTPEARGTDGTVYTG